MRIRRLALLGVVAGALVAAAPAQAINDVLVPGDNCSPDNSAAVGNNPNPGIAQSEQVSPPVSRSNPGVFENPSGVPTGAQGERKSKALQHCPNNLD